jgi:plasmid stabilization system protein ParE
MSARSRRYLTIREAAKRDIDDILLYTRRRWGIDQRRRQRAQLRQAMRSLLDYPELGPPRDDPFSGCRNLPLEHHVVFYHIAGNEIVVGRVLHSSQDPSGKVTP